MTVLAVMTFFFELFDFGIEAPGTPQNAPLGLAAGFDEPRNFSTRKTKISVTYQAWETRAA